MRDWPDHPIPVFDRAVFLDRDGTINVDTHYTYRREELDFLPGSLEAVRRLGNLPLHVIVVTNQAGIALGKYTEPEMALFHAEMREKVERRGGRIDAFYFSPAREPKDLPPGERASFSSKPNPGMLYEAAGDFGISLADSFLVGDKASDVAAGKAAGCFTILVLTGKAGRAMGEAWTEPDLIVPDLLAAADAIAARVERQRIAVGRR